MRTNGTGGRRARFEAAKRAFLGRTDGELQVVLINSAIAQMATLGKWQDRWLTHPLPDMSEPRKAVCCLTDCGDYDTDHLARLYLKASLRGIDRFFMQVRRRLSLLERPIATASKSRRMWYDSRAHKQRAGYPALCFPNTFAKRLAVAAGSSPTT